MEKNKNKVVVMGNFDDNQSALYILTSFTNSCEKAVGINIRRIVNELGMEKGQKMILDELKGLGIEPDIIMVLKGTEMSPSTIKSIREAYPKTKFVNWFFDKMLIDKPIWETEQYFDVLKIYDKFYCSLKGVADKLKEVGFSNAEFLPEACDQIYHSEQYMNNFQKKKYGSDVSFAGSLGFFKHHPNRVPILQRIAEEGYDLKIWGDIVCEPKSLPKILRDCHTGYKAINESHSMLAQCSINLGIDQDPDLSLSFSARLYRVLCANGCYVTTYCKDMETMFKLNDGLNITGEEEVIVYKNVEELIKILDFLLKKPDIKDRIGKNGQKLVLEKHKFDDRIKTLFAFISENGGK